LDGAWSVIGSSNFDQGSALFNGEVDTVVLGSETAQELEKIYEDDQRGAREIGREAWQDRPLTQKDEEALFARSGRTFSRA
jgi:cardiolipin synthase A/B